MPKQTPIWCVCRVVDYQLAWLEHPDTYAPLSLSTWVTRDREEAYQAARAQRGLLVRCDGLPDEVSLRIFSKALEQLGTDGSDAAVAA